VRRVLPIIVAAALLAGFSVPVRADCMQEIAAMRTRLASLDDPAKHRELELLLAKAQNDDKAGRTQICADDLRHAEALVK
jgi:hypothetical protein